MRPIVILVFFECPERTRLFFIPAEQLTTEHIQALWRANGTMVNGQGQNEATAAVAASVLGGDWDDTVPPEWVGQWQKYEKKSPVTFDRNVQVTTVFECGMHV